MSYLEGRIAAIDTERTRNIASLHAAVLGKDWADVVAVASVLMGLDCAIKELRGAELVPVESDAVQLRRVILTGTGRRQVYAALAITKALGTKTMRVPEIVPLLKQHGFESSQKNPSEYVRYVLSKNKHLFEKAGRPGSGLYRNRVKKLT